MMGCLPQRWPIWLKPELVRIDGPPVGPFPTSHPFQGRPLVPRPGANQGIFRSIPVCRLGSSTAGIGPVQGFLAGVMPRRLGHAGEPSRSARSSLSDCFGESPRNPGDVDQDRRRRSGKAEQKSSDVFHSQPLRRSQGPAGLGPARTAVLTGTAPNASTSAGRLVLDRGRLRLMTG
jgi:hypothetical protein